MSAQQEGPALYMPLRSLSLFDTHRSLRGKGLTTAASCEGKLRLGEDVVEGGGQGSRQGPGKVLAFSKTRAELGVAGGAPESHKVRVPRGVDSAEDQLVFRAG